MENITKTTIRTGRNSSVNSTFADLNQTTIGLHTMAATTIIIKTPSRSFSIGSREREVSPTIPTVRSTRMNAANQHPQTIAADTTAIKKNETIRSDKGLIFRELW